MLLVKQQRRISPDSAIPITLALLALVFGILMAITVTQRLPHVEDEIAYLYQARTYARGVLWAPPPPDLSAFFVPFWLIIRDHWISKYPIGWPMLLAIGEVFHAGWLVAPTLGAMMVALIYQLGAELYDRQIGLIAGILALSSPFYLIQSSTFMSHPASALWTTLLLWAWLRLERTSRQQKPTVKWSLLAGASLGMIAITRPLTAVGVAVPFAVAPFVQLIRQRDVGQLLRTYWPFVVAAAAVTALYPLYLWIVTGSPTTNLYTLIWPYDRIGFGPDISHSNGHDLHQGMVNAKNDLLLWYSDLFGWKNTSWLPLIPGLLFGLMDARRREKGWPLLLGGVFVALVVVHLAYWVGAQVYGPRYYYEGLAGLAILAALGLRGSVRVLVNLAHTHRLTLAKGQGTTLNNTWPVYLLLAILISLNMLTYLPNRVNHWHNLYNINRDPIQAVREARQTDYVLVLVKGGRWVEYGALMSLNSPWLDGPTVVGHYDDLLTLDTVRSLFPDREVLYVEGNRVSHDPPVPTTPDTSE